MDVVKFPARNRHVCWGSFGMFNGFGSLTGYTSFSPCSNLWGHTNLADMIFFVFLTDGWDKPCSKSKILLLQESGTTGLAFPWEMSHKSLTSGSPNDTQSSIRLLSGTSAATFSEIWFLVIVRKSISVLNVFTLCLDRPSATTLFFPITCLMSEENSAMKLNCSLLSSWSWLRYFS